MFVGSHSSTGLLKAKTFHQADAYTGESLVCITMAEETSRNSICRERFAAIWRTTITAKHQGYEILTHIYFCEVIPLFILRRLTGKIHIVVNFYSTAKTSWAESPL